MMLSLLPLKPTPDREEIEREKRQDLILDILALITVLAAAIAGLAWGIIEWSMR